MGSAAGPLRVLFVAVEGAMKKPTRKPVVKKAKKWGVIHVGVERRYRDRARFATRAEARDHLDSSCVACGCQVVKL